MNSDIIFTEDGSATLYSSEYDDHYHSVKGAHSESMHIFINSGLRKVMENKQQINILEIGFGTGLNALCTLEASLEFNLKINYIGIEPKPVELDLIARLNYPSLFKNYDFSEQFLQMHQLPKNKPHYISDNFVLNVIKAQVQEVDFKESSFDLIYFDAFKPSTHTDTWTPQVFSKLFNALSNHGILLTYSSSSSVRKNMESSGFSVDKIPGPAGKHQITRAIKEIPVTESLNLF